MAGTRIIVCEATSRWAVGLRRQLGGESWVEIYETRHFDDCRDEATATPDCLVMLEVTSVNLEALAGELLRYRVELPEVPIIVTGSRQLQAAQWLLRECGAVHAVFSLRELGSVAGMVRRHWQRLVARPMPAPLPWRHLPWARVATGTAAQFSEWEPDWLVSQRR